jgi:hypothetical protein
MTGSRCHVRRVLCLVACAAWPVSSGSAAVPLTPAPGSSSTGHLTTFTWTVDTEDVPYALVVSTSPVVDPLGAFILVDQRRQSGYLGRGVTSTTLDLREGSYWWQLEYTAPGRPPAVYTTPVPFTVPAPRPAAPISPTDGQTLTRAPTSLQIAIGDVSVSELSLARSQASLFATAGQDPGVIETVANPGADTGGTVSLPLSPAIADELASGTYWWGYRWTYLPTFLDDPTQQRVLSFVVAPAITKPQVAISTTATQAGRVLRVVATFRSNARAPLLRIKLRHAHATLVTRTVTLAARAGSVARARSVSLRLAIPRRVRAGTGYRVEVTVSSGTMHRTSTAGVRVPRRR